MRALVITVLILLVLITSAAHERRGAPPTKTERIHLSQTKQDNKPQKEKKKKEPVEIPPPATDDEFAKDPFEISDEIPDSYEPQGIYDPHHPESTEREFYRSGREPPPLEPGDLPPIADNLLDHDPPYFPENLNGHNETSIQEKIMYPTRHMSTRYLLYVYTSKADQCDRCQQHLAEFIEVTKNFALEEENIKMEHRLFTFGYYDVFRMEGKDSEFFDRIMPTKALHPPYLLLLDHDNAQFHTKPTQLPIHSYTFAADLEFYLHKMTKMHDFFGVRDAQSLMHAIFDSHNDGVTVLMTKIFNITPETEARFEVWRRVINEDHQYMHFAEIMPEYDDKGMPIPNIDWMLEYNPDEHDIVAFIADDKHHTFRTVGFNFPPYEPRHNYKALLELREFVDELKGHRHKHSARRSHGYRKIRQYHIGEGGILIGDDELPEDFCTHSTTARGHRAIVSITGYSVDHTNAVFLQIKEAEVVIGQIPELSPKLNHLLEGMCSDHEKEVFVPANHGFHAEHYHIHVHKVVDFGDSAKDEEDL